MLPTGPSSTRLLFPTKSNSSLHCKRDKLVNKKHGSTDEWIHNRWLLPDRTGLDRPVRVCMCGGGPGRRAAGNLQVTVRALNHCACSSPAAHGGVGVASNGGPKQAAPPGCRHPSRDATRGDARPGEARPGQAYVCVCCGPCHASC